MKINYIKGDLLSTTEGIIMHGCNAQGVMGSGVALAVRQKYPKVYEKYKQGIQLGFLGLGDVQFIKVAEDLFVCNAITQEFYGREKKLYVSYKAIRNAFQTVFNLSAYDVNIPKIGAGLGGGDWGAIISIITDVATEQGYTGVLNVYEL